MAIAGSAGLDVTLRNPPRHWIGEVGRDVYTQQTLLPLALPAEMGLGGNGGSAAYVLAKLGGRVHLNAPIGIDPIGYLVREWLTEAGVKCVAPVGQSTMHAITAVDAQGKRLGTLQHVGPPIDWDLSAQDQEAACLLVSLPGQVSVEVMPQVLKLLKSFEQPSRVRVLDIGAGWTEKVSCKRVLELWAHTEVVVGTLEELKTWVASQTIQLVAQRVLAAGPHTVVMKMGSEGVAYQSRSDSFAQQPALELRQANVSIGAGDAFNGALVAGLLHGQTLAEAVAGAQRVAVKVVEGGRGVLGWAKGGF